ncbi:MAG: ATP-binding protein [Pseudonocardiaceae bacterium]|nr:ATP-binding protein [Pseudonocardiaceae bacterium]
MTVPAPGGDDVAEPAHDDTDQGEDVQRTVQVRVGAAPVHLPPLRSVVADLATRADFDLDSVADLRLAVDESAAELIAVAAPGALLTGSYLVDDDQMQVTVSVPVVAGAMLRRDSFGWRVLTTLVDEVRVLDGREGDQPRLGITLRKKRGQHGSAAGTFDR